MTSDLEEGQQDLSISPEMLLLSRRASNVAARETLISEALITPNKSDTTKFNRCKCEVLCVSSTQFSGKENLKNKKSALLTKF